MNKVMHVLHITPHVGRASFGIGPVVLSLAASQQNLGWDTSIWTHDSKSEVADLVKQYGLRCGTMTTFPIVGPQRLSFSPAMERKIVEEGATIDIVHQHGIWTAVSRCTNKWRGHTAGPTIVAPHGSLDEWALRRSRWKKKMALTFYEQVNLSNASCLHALSLREAEGFRSFGLTAPIAVIPNGISDNWLHGQGDKTRFHRKFHLPNDVRPMLFLGRITPKKGLPMLVQAMRKLRTELGNWRLIIAGVDEFAHQRELNVIINELDIQQFVQFVGPLYGQDKIDAFAAAELFILPSHSEGAPMVILEALGAGVPVLTTKASPWEELITYNCGWWIDISAEAIAEALKDALKRSQIELRKMGQRGKKLVGGKYTWSQIGEQTLILYDWILHGGVQPKFVITE